MTTTTDPAKQSDERLDEILFDTWQSHKCVGATDGHSYQAALAAMRQVRDEMAAQLAAAQERIRQLEGATAWQPIEGRFGDAQGDSVELIVDGRYLSLFASGEIMTFALDDDITLCRRQDAAEEEA